MRVRTDININGSKIYISARTAKLIGCRRGRALFLHWEGSEVYIGTVDNANRMYMGMLYPVSGGYRCSCLSLARELTQSHKAAFRCGEAKVVNGKTMVAIITRKNYADSRDTSQGGDKGNG